MSVTARIVLMAFRAHDGWPECGSEHPHSAVQHAVQSSSLPQMAKRVSLTASVVTAQFPIVRLPKKSGKQAIAKSVVADDLDPKGTRPR